MDAVQRCSFGEFYIPHPPATASSTREGTLTHNTDGQRRVGASAADAGGGGAVNAAAATRHGLPDMDAGRLRHLIRSGDLAPCFDGADDAVGGYVEECPICFYLMPSKTSEAVQYPICDFVI
ncbi:hypothetical protein PR202_ga14775 [Eleusine coracana subsp. coracana]|uniref:Uncharacterized protein n=1 Tax=Eleusine coracana subsp. coracana TaxID=191504 RepID=A0AAV5CIF6_ELECO|nr:hypothetical protein PR202_ga14775 [Eleusine coracana subsp. coracana]